MEIVVTLIGLVVCVALGGCTHERGTWQRASATRLDRAAGPAISIVALGNVSPGPAAKQTADRIADTLADERAAGRHPIVLWLGGLGSVRHPGGRCLDPARAWQRRGLTDVARIVSAHVDTAAASYAVFGADDWRCHADNAAPGVWQRPADNYVVRVGSDGRTSVVSTCNASPVHCRIEPVGEPPALELVILDVTPWHAPKHQLASTELPQRTAMQAALLDALRQHPSGAPRILVSASPLMTAGPSGLGGRRSSTGFHRLPSHLRQAVLDGEFTGAIAGGDATLQFVSDGSDAIRRGARAWPRAPLFHVVATGSTHTRVSPRRSLDRFPQRRGITVVPDMASDGPGFVQLLVSGNALNVRLHDRTRWRWRVADAGVDLVRAAHPAEGPAPATQPCLHCTDRRIDVARSSP